MKRIGIITLYNMNYNYGGVLQAYALVKALNKNGYYAEQIKYINKKVDKKNLIDICKNYSLKEIIERIKKEIFKKIIVLRDRKIKDRYSIDIERRKSKFDKFIDEIPHTKLVTNDTIKELNNHFDSFITGSDQVWNPHWWSDEYFLAFTNKKKISYAASMGENIESPYKINYFAAMVPTLDAVSVREEGLKELIEMVTDIKARIVIDPVFLLMDKDWRQIKIQRSIPQSYIFVYLLGKERGIYKKIEKIACQLKLPIVYLAFSQPLALYKEIGFGDKIIMDAAPGEFLYLLDNATYVITDSFHACSFSLLFHKEFYVIERYLLGKKLSNDRINTLMKNFGLSNRSIESFSDIEENVNINWDTVDTTIQKYRKEGIQYLIDNL